jgi:hypothetical protein
MKRILLIALIALLALAITACRGEDEEEYTPPEVENQDNEIEDEDTEEALPENGEDEANEEGVDREEDEEDTGRDEGEPDGEIADHIRDPNLLSPEELDAMFGVEVGVWDDEAFELVDGMEEELSELIDHLNEELDRVILGSEDDDWIDNVVDRLDDFIDRMYEQWDDLHEQFESGLISSQDFIRGLESVLQQIRTYTF